MTTTSTTATDIASNATMPPCPWWCRSSDVDHRRDYDSTLVDEPTALSRAHVHQFGDAAVVQYETNLSGTVTLEAPRISIYVEQVDDAAAASRLSLDLDAAAVLLRRLGVEMSPTISLSADSERLG